MTEISVVGIDLAKRVFRVHAVDGAGRAVIGRSVRRHELVGLVASLPACVVAMEACAGAHHWARQFQALGHRVRLIPPSRVKPFVGRQKNDAADAAAICEAAQRPAMRFAAVKTEQQQALLLDHRTRDLLIRQRTMMVNALRGHLAEFGIVAAKGPAGAQALMASVEAEAGPPGVPAVAAPALRLLAARRAAAGRAGNSGCAGPSKSACRRRNDSPAATGQINPDPVFGNGPAIGRDGIILRRVFEIEKRARRMPLTRAWLCRKLNRRCGALPIAWKPPWTCGPTTIAVAAISGVPRDCRPGFCVSSISRWFLLRSGWHMHRACRPANGRTSCLRLWRLRPMRRF
jgi:hypothetical protein